MKFRCIVVSELWEREKGVLTKRYISKKSKKNTAILKKLNMMSNEMKDSVIQAYLLRCKYKFSVVYSEWRMQLKYNKNMKFDPKQVRITLYNYYIERDRHAKVLEEERIALWLRKIAV